ncbi:MAG: hypothetical protein N2504_01345 [candidate division WOR-3 bacterium]|nr:hypothetical protein [candidate division WOR-3 bacterium]MCX7947217.1 hypothetical protein [candidate division WOR-3 bacterium]MDW8150272.1 hypothetical protein [candidate division WOR-3 bacterium]
MPNKFLVLLDFDNLYIKTEVNQKAVLLGEKPIFLNTLPSLNFDDIHAVIITNCTLHNFGKVHIIYRGEHNLEDILNAYKLDNLKELNRTYFGIIFDEIKKNIIIFGNVFLYKEKYRERYFIFNDFENFYKLSETFLDKQTLREFILKKQILELESKIIISDLNSKNIKLYNMKPLLRKLIYKKIKASININKFLYYIEPSDVLVFMEYKFSKLPISFHSLYQFESMYNTSLEIDFDSRVKTNVNLRDFIVLHFNDTYEGYKLFKLNSWLYDFLFRPNIVYRTFIFFTIIRNFRL